MGRINIELPDDIHRQMKASCALRGIILEEFINQAVTESLQKESRTQGRQP
ncbi:MAG: hypothetical protein GXP63_02855 [DPANN group archaeon]|nr:hypothetical protein [DPANN group archaeon]